MSPSVRHALVLASPALVAGALATWTMASHKPLGEAAGLLGAVYEGSGLFLALTALRRAGISDVARARDYQPDKMGAPILDTELPVPVPPFWE